MVDLENITVAHGVNMFDPKNPPVRKKKYDIHVDGEKFQHEVREVQIGIIDDVLEQVSRIFDFDLEKDVGEQIRTSYKDYPNEFIAVLSKLTGYEEEDIKRWGISLTEEITLDWINGNYGFITDVWGKKKGVLGKMGEAEEQKENPEEKQKEEPLIGSETLSGS
jgi:hypothetical protein